MKVTKDKVENNQAYLTIEMEPGEVEEGLNKAYRKSFFVIMAHMAMAERPRTCNTLLEQPHHS